MHPRVWRNVRSPSGATATNRRRGLPAAVHDHARGVDTMFLELVGDEPAELVVANAGDDPDAEPQLRKIDAVVRRRSPRW